MPELICDALKQQVARSMPTASQMQRLGGVSCLLLFQVHLKSNAHSDYTRALENEILPLLRKQKGFKEEITLSNPGSQDAIAISPWENKASADAYNTNLYPEVLRTFAKMLDGTPEVQTFDAVTSTFHNALVAA